MYESIFAHVWEFFHIHLQFARDRYQTWYLRQTICRLIDKYSNYDAPQYSTNTVQKTLHTSVWISLLARTASKCFSTSFFPFAAAQWIAARPYWPQQKQLTQNSIFIIFHLHYSYPSRRYLLFDETILLEGVVSLYSGRLVGRLCTEGAWRAFLKYVPVGNDRSQKINIQTRRKPFLRVVKGKHVGREVRGHFQTLGGHSQAWTILHWRKGNTFSLKFKFEVIWMGFRLKLLWKKIS